MLHKSPSRDLPDPVATGRTERVGIVESPTTAMSLVRMAPVFVDDSGRRRRWLVVTAYAVAAVSIVYVLVVGISVLRGSEHPLTDNSLAGVLFPGSFTDGGPTPVAENQEGGLEALAGTTRRASAVKATKAVQPTKSAPAPKPAPPALVAVPTVPATPTPTPTTTRCARRGPPDPTDHRAGSPAADLVPPAPARPGPG